MFYNDQILEKLEVQRIANINRAKYDHPPLTPREQADLSLMAILDAAAMTPPVSDEQPQTK